MSKINLIAVVFLSLILTSSIVAFAIFNSNQNNQNNFVQIQHEDRSKKDLSQIQTKDQTKENLKTEEECIIIVSGQRYNVQKLRKKHPGGDIFVCNTDMTEMFNQKHGDLERLEPYKIN